MAPITPPAPDMSNFIHSISAPGLIEMPPVSKQMPLPTSTIGASSAAPPVYSIATSRGSCGVPCATARKAPMPSCSISSRPSDGDLHVAVPLGDVARRLDEGVGGADVARHHAEAARHGLSGGERLADARTRRGEPRCLPRGPWPDASGGATLRLRRRRLADRDSSTRRAPRPATSPSICSGAGVDAPACIAPVPELHGGPGRHGSGTSPRRPCRLALAQPHQQHALHARSRPRAANVSSRAAAEVAARQRARQRAVHRRVERLPAQSGRAMAPSAGAEKNRASSGESTAVTAA